jgi:hypothetical protein
MAKNTIISKIKTEQHDETYDNIMYQSIPAVPIHPPPPGHPGLRSFPNPGGGAIAEMFQPGGGDLDVFHHVD